MATLSNDEDIESFLSGPVTRKKLSNLKKNDLEKIASHLEILLPPNPAKSQIITEILSIQGSNEESDSSKISDPELIKLELERERLKCRQQELKLQQAREEAQQAKEAAQLQFQREESARKSLQEREEAQRKHEEAQRKHEEAQRKHEEAREEAQRRHEEAQFQREESARKSLQEREEAQKEAQRKHELRLQEMRLEELKLKGKGDESHSSFDVTKHIRLVPKFNEVEVAKYFQMFEKVASSLNWDKSVWPILLQSVLVGKAQETFSALTPNQSSDYDYVKGAILKAYELVPEAYRQKFRNLQKQHSQTYVEFAREKANLFNRWCESKEVDNFESLRQLILMEEFKRCVPKEIKLHLEETKIDILEKASTVADDYALVHKAVFSKSSYTRKVSFEPKSSSSQVLNERVESEKVSEISKPSIISNFPKDISCSYCKKKGHLVSECFKLKNRERKFVGLTNSRVPKSNFKFTPANHTLWKTPTSTCKDLEGFESFLSKGSVSTVGNPGRRKPIVILRDTACRQSIMVKNILPFEETEGGKSVIISGIGNSQEVLPLQEVILSSDIITGPVLVGITSALPIEGVDLLLGNDLAGDKVIVSPVVTSSPIMREETERLETEIPGIFPSCVVTRSIAKSQQNSNDDTRSKSYCDKLSLCDNNMLSLTKEGLIEAQKRDPELKKLFNMALSEEESLKLPECFFTASGILMRKWRHPEVSANEEWRNFYQVVVPSPYRELVLKCAHELPMAGHLGSKKTLEKIMAHFFWPRLRNDVKDYCKTCHICQLVGKPNKPIEKAPLIPIPAFEPPFTRVLMDVVGPLPKTKAGNIYLLTLMDVSTRFPEAIPLRNIKAPTIVNVMLQFFSRFGLPKEVQTDQGTNFMSQTFQQALQELGIKQIRSTAYHPESQGALERYHQTLKTMMRKYCLEFEKDWDKGIHFLLFATRDSPSESLGFTPFELLFGHQVRGPLKLLKDKFLLESETTNLLSYVQDFQERLNSCWKIANQNLVKAQRKMKVWYDEKARARSFRAGEKVLLFLPMQGNPLMAKFCGPYIIDKKVNDVNYVVCTPDRRRGKRLCHVNMIKPYFEKDSKVMAFQSEVSNMGTEDQCVDDFSPKIETSLNNSAIINHLDVKLCHLSGKQQEELKGVLNEYSDLFKDHPGRTSLTKHDVDVGDSRPIKQHPYRMNPVKQELIRKEIQYMLDNELIEPSNSEWSSPVVLVPKPDGSHRLCVDYRKVNSVTRDDSYPLPRVDDCIDRIGNAKFVSKYDLLKGYWQVSLTDRAKEISAFVTQDGVFACKVMPFGYKNAPATFQRLMNSIIAGLEGCCVYIDDVVVFSDTWEEHLERTRIFFERLRAAGLVVNLAKSEIGKAQVTYLGHVVGQGKVYPNNAKTKAIFHFPVPSTKKELMRFLGMAGYYRKFVHNFADLVSPLTHLLGKKVKFSWTTGCQEAFEKVKTVLVNEPVLLAPNFNKPFKLAVDASDVAVGAVLLQEHDGIEHPVCYFSRKLCKHQMPYSTIEKETLALIMALQHFDVYLSNPVSPIEVYTDHNPLVFLDKFKNKNQRLIRWGLFLQEYSLIVKHIKGKDNVIADSLSRIMLR